MRLLRCRICGDTYLGTDPPSRCPFCGAAASYFVEPGGFSSIENAVPLTELERVNLESAVEIELSNARYYLAVAGLPGDEDLASAFKRLAKVEAEHCGLFCKLLGIPKPGSLGTAVEPPPGWCEAVAESARRESFAVGFYTDAISTSTNERVKEVFVAIAEVERDHLVVDEVISSHAGCV
jgi:rubrerythrin